MQIVPKWARAPVLLLESVPRVDFWITLSSYLDRKEMVKVLRHFSGYLHKHSFFALILFFAFLPTLFSQALSPKEFRWAPPDIETEKPSTPSVPCNLDEVLPAASRRVQQFVLNMQQFSATEELEFEVADEDGRHHSAQKAKFTYVAYIHEDSPDNLVVDEYRNDSVAETQFPSKLATVGTAAFALLLHPNNLKAFSATCEGQTEYRGRRAWLVRLTQVTPNDFRGYRVANRFYRVMLKVLVWIDAENFDVLKLETNLLNPIKEIPLNSEAVVVEYGTVDFPNRKVQLWLPQAADIYMDYRGHRYHHRHTFSNFQLFMVDTTQKVKPPK